MVHSTSARLMASSQQSAVRTMDSGLAIMNFSNEVGVELLRNALVAAKLTESEDICQEVPVLGSMIHALFVIDAIDDLVRLQEVAVQKR